MRFLFIALLLTTLVACSHSTVTKPTATARSLASEGDPDLYTIKVQGEGEDLRVIKEAGYDSLSGFSATKIWIAKKTSKCEAEIGYYTVARSTPKEFTIDYVLEMTGACINVTFPKGDESARLKAVDESYGSVLFSIPAGGDLSETRLSAGYADLIYLSQGNDEQWLVKAQISAKQIENSQLTPNACEQGATDAWMTPKENKLLVAYGERINVLTFKAGQVSQVNLLGSIPRRKGELMMCAAVGMGFGKAPARRGLVRFGNDGSLILINEKDPSKSSKLKDF